MRISQLSTQGQGDWPDLHLDRIHPGLNVVYAGPRTGKSTVAQLAGYLLYGKADSPWRRQFGQTVADVEGALTLDTPWGRFSLRRHRDQSPQGRLTISSADDATVDRRIVQSLRWRRSTRLFSQLFAVDFAQTPRVNWLLSESFAQEFNSSRQAIGIASLDCPRIDKLIRQRDLLVQEIEDKRAELARLEAAIGQCRRNRPTSLARTRQGLARSRSWRASDVLARLTEGELVQIRLRRHGRRATVVDRTGRWLSLDHLTSTQHDQLYLALTLALADSYARHGVHLPLILDEPFLRQDQASAVRLASVLAAFARDGHQLLVCTEDRAARLRFESLKCAIFDLENLPRNTPSTSTTSVVAEAPQELDSARTTARVVRELLDDHHAPCLRLVTVNREGEDLFFLSEGCSLDDFPVLGSGSSEKFARIDIHSVGQLLIADPGEVARRLDCEGIHDETVRLWQIHMRLMCQVPELTLNDAQVLSASGIQSVEDLADADAEQLIATVHAFCDTKEGQRILCHSDAPSGDKIEAWIRGAKQSQPLEAA